MSILAIDAGTTGVTVLVVTPEGGVAGHGYAEFRQHFPAPGWVEHSPEDIWQAVLDATGQARAAASEAGAGQISAVGLTNQRETAVIWDRATLAAPRRAIVWQDRRTAQLCGDLRSAGHEDRVSEVTGLRLDPYFTGTKLAWLARHEPDLWAGVTGGSLAVGTVDSYLIARLTGGRAHVTDASNASRTLLFDLARGDWSPEMCELLAVPPRALPQVVPSCGVAGQTDPAAFGGLSVPIAGIAGDQQAALFGQACFEPGVMKCTYGTGSFVLASTGAQIVRSQAGLLSTVAWMMPDGGLQYALEGSVFVTGAALQWLRDGLGLLDNAAQSEALAGGVADSGGVVFVPALTGLGAPHWEPDARGAIFGLTRGTSRAQLVRAALEAIAFEVREVTDIISAETAGASRAAGAGAAGPGSPDASEPAALRADGGASANNLLMQLQADQLQVPVERPTVAETTAVGAAFLAGLATGVWSSQAELAAIRQVDRRFEPGKRDEQAYERWRSAVRATVSWRG